MQMNFFFVSIFLFDFSAAQVSVSLNDRLGWLWPISPAPGSSIGMLDEVAISVGVAYFDSRYRVEKVAPPFGVARPTSVCATVAGIPIGCISNDNSTSGIFFNPAAVGLQPETVFSINLQVTLVLPGSNLIYVVPLSYEAHCVSSFERWSKLPLFSIPVFDGTRQLFIDYYNSDSPMYNRDLARRSCAILGDMFIPAEEKFNGGRVDRRNGTSKSEGPPSHSFYRIVTGMATGTNEAAAATMTTTRTTTTTTTTLDLSHVGEACTSRIELFVRSRAIEWRSRLAAVSQYQWRYPSPDCRDNTSNDPSTQIIPKIIHFIWLGSSPLPALYEKYRLTWKRNQPDWESWMWSDDTPRMKSFLGQGSEVTLGAPKMRNMNLFVRLADLRARADLLRYEIIYAFGGVYVDTDMECIRPLSPLFGSNVTLVVGREDNFQINNAIIAARKRHPALELLLLNVAPRVESLANNVGIHDVWELTGPSLFTRAIDIYLKGAYSISRSSAGTVVVAPPPVFSPLHFSMASASIAAQFLMRAAASESEAYTIHHWGSKMKLDEEGNSPLPASPSLAITNITLRPIQKFKFYQALESVSFRLCSGDQLSWRLCLVLEQQISVAGNLFGETLIAKFDEVQEDKCRTGMVCSRILACQEYTVPRDNRQSSRCYPVRWRPSGTQSGTRQQEKEILIPIPQDSGDAVALRLDLLDEAGVLMCSPSFIAITREPTTTQVGMTSK